VARLLETNSGFKYRAFISYSHRDTPWARWLHHALERYRPDRDLVDRETSAGPVPRTLRPIFRDRDEFSAGSSLTGQSLVALAASQFLVVVCSPNAARSKYVDEEVRYFKANGGAARIIPIIVEGEPGSPQSDCFPPAMGVKVGPDGSLTDEPQEPLAADARPHGDGKDLAKQKVIAGLLGLGLDEIIRRAERARKRQLQYVAALAAVFLVLAIAAAGSAVFAYQKLTESNERLDEAIQIAYGIVTKADTVADRYGVPQDLTLDLLGQAENALNGLIAQGADTPMLRHRQALMLISFSDSFRLLGQYDEAIQRAADARDLFVGLTTRDPRNMEWQNELATSEYKLGDVNMYWGHFTDASQHFHASAELFKRYPEQKQNSILSFVGEGSALYYEFWANTWLGYMQLLIGDSDAALAHIEVGRALAQRVASANPSDAIGRRNLGLSELVRCMVQRARGDYAEAIQHCRVAAAAMKGLVTENAANSRWQRDLAWTEMNLAWALVKAGSSDEAMDALRSAISIDESLVASDTKNILWMWHLWTGYFLLAQGELKLGKIEEAQAKCRASFALVEQQALRDVRNFVIRRQFAWSHFCLGDVQKAQSNADRALDAYAHGIDILEDLARSDSKSALRKSDLAWGYLKIGDALAALGRKDEAVVDFRKATALAQQIVDVDPNSADWEWALLWSEWRRVEQGDEAAICLRDMVQRLQKLARENRLSADLAWLMPRAIARLGKQSSE
jgi:eukaryotic-like serine/threonine-protein kinase